MPGMSHQVQADNPLVVAAFHSALLHQFLLILAVSVGMALVWNVLFTVQFRRGASRAAVAGVTERAAAPGPAGGSIHPSGAGARLGGPGAAVLTSGEPPARRFLRVAFGLLWLFDGLLQMQSKMPLGMPTGVVKPAENGTPSFVHHFVGAGLTIWTDHPVEAAAAAVWIQVGIGLALLLAPRGRWSRVAGVVSVGWALVVWSFGEAFGGALAAGPSWAFGLPGAVLFYAVAGGLLALPETGWREPRLGRLVTGGMGLFFLGMSLLQAWPGRGYWIGRSPHPGNLLTMVRTMAGTPQPHLLSTWLTAFAGFDAAHGWAVNLFLVVALAVIGLLLVTGARQLVVTGAVAAIPLCLATWVLVQDFGFFGGVGTDPNSMVPQLLVLWGGVVALVRAPAVAREPSFVSVREVLGRSGPGRWELLSPGVLARAAVGALTGFVVLVGVVPMAVASANPNADPILTEALNGSPNYVDSPAPGFSLVDQRGQKVSPESLRGRAVALTFLDPVCTSDCPVIAQTFHVADEMLGSLAKRTVFVAIDANPVYRSVGTIDAFDREEHLTGVQNWLYLTGSLEALTKAWDGYGIQVSVSSAGAMVAHSETAYLIDPDGRMREILGDEPGTTSSARSSMAGLVANGLRALLPS
jgi:cytochrome oxidase Cu insertion factor (SCO1/SenC/PrrC family)